MKKNTRIHKPEEYTKNQSLTNHKKVEDAEYFAKGSSVLIQNCRGARVAFQSPANYVSKHLIRNLY
jgi:hypothetical protein